MQSLSIIPYMMELLHKKLFSYMEGKQIVVVCIGTDAVGGDCLGPLVGQFLQERNVPAFVYGTLSHPVTALNVNQTGEFIRQNHKNSLVVAVDSAVGSKLEEGLIRVSGKGLLPGLADGKRLCSIGDVSVTAVTSAYVPGDKRFSLVRLGFVYRLAQQIAELISDCLSNSLYSGKTRCVASKPACL